MTTSVLCTLALRENDFLAWRAVASGKKVKSIGKAYPGERKKKKRRQANSTFLLHQSFSQSCSLASLSLIHAFMRTPPSTSSAAACVCVASEHTCTTDAISALSLFLSPSQTGYLNSLQSHPPSAYQAVDDHYKRSEPHVYSAHTLERVFATRGREQHYSNSKCSAVQCSSVQFSAVCHVLASMPL